MDACFEILLSTKQPIDNLECYQKTILPIESLPNEQVLALCDMQMETEQQEVFSNLLARNQEGQLNEAEVKQLDELMQVYRRGMVSKARALKVAVERGLKPSVTFI